MLYQEGNLEMQMLQITVGIFALILILWGGPKYIANQFYLDRPNHAYLALLITIAAAVADCIYILYVTGKI